MTRIVQRPARASGRHAARGARTRTAVRRGLSGVALAAVVTVAGTGSPAAADEAGSIDYVETVDGALQLLYSLPELPPAAGVDLRSLEVTVNGTPVEAVASATGEGQDVTAVERSTVLAMDTSGSMRGDRFTRAKQAAQAFLEAAPPDVRVGLVTFSREVRTVVTPTVDRDRLAEAVAGLSLSPGTYLYDGVTEAVEVAGNDGQRSVLVLSDGRDTSETPLEKVTTVVEDAGVHVDVVALEQDAAARRPLEEMATAGGGTVITAEDADALVQVFSGEADALARQVLVEMPVPAGLAGTEGTVGVSLEADGTTYSDSAFVALPRHSTAEPAALDAPREVQPDGVSVSPTLMWVGVGAAGLGVLLLLLTVMGVFERKKVQPLEDRIASYTRDPRAGGRRAAQETPKGLSGSAVGVAEKALSGNAGMEAALGTRLDGAGMSLKPAEWLLLHAGAALGAGLLGFLLGSGGVLLTVLFLLAGAIVPWFYLSMKRSRRLKAFNSHLSETLQLVSGSLSAGLSLAQSIDTVVKEGSEPIAGEFRRALVESRLGVPIEDALDSVAERMGSDDFGWVVMAIRIQREVGGNLSELLLSVAATMREREYLRRQVKALSAEGRMSAWILGALPPFFLVYLSVANPTYIQPMLAEPLGWFMLGAMGVLLVVGTFWLSRVAKVEV